MNITYVSSFDATDINSYSGTGYYIPLKLREAGDSLSYIGNLSSINPLYHRLKRRLYKAADKNYLIERNPGILNQWAHHIKKKLDPATDVLTAYSSQPFSMLHTNKPLVFWTDAVFASMIDYYPVYSNLCSESKKHGNQMEKNAIDNASMAVYSSHWAAQAAIKIYGADSSKVRVVPYGANIDVDYSQQDIIRMAKNKPSEYCHLLFLGVEWHRKGGDIAVETARAMNKNGFKTRLSVVGTEPPEAVKDLPFVDSYGYVSKSTSQGRKLLHDLIAGSHFLILPTRADCTPIVYNEFNAYGIPVITTNEGGIPSIVTDGVNGYMFPKETDPEVFADCIISKLANRENYIELSSSSYNEYKTRLNWTHSIKKFRDILKEVV